MISLPRRKERPGEIVGTLSSMPRHIHIHCGHRVEKASEESLLLHSSKTLSLQLSTGCIIRLSVDIMNIAQIIFFAVVAAASAADATKVAAAHPARRSTPCDGPCSPHKNSSCETGYGPVEEKPTCWLCCQLPSH
ncbi:hypothetical protein P692DRAFT_20221959 [Suillus brevipes Sb2]|nr:hypothetical protein P692DRAFT_20221959 [Suillus brevipes Sb2]